MSGILRANVKRAVEVEVEHALKSRAIGFGNRFAAGKSAHQMSQNIDPAESATIPSTVLFASSALERFAKTVTKGGVSELDGGAVPEMPITVAPLFSRAWVT
jgi:hypothetical protein